MNSWNNCCCGGFLSCWLEVQVTSGQTHNSPGLPQLLCLCQEDAQHVVLFQALTDVRVFLGPVLTSLGGDCWATWVPTPKEGAGSRRGRRIVHCTGEGRVSGALLCRTVQLWDPPSQDIVKSRVWITACSLFPTRSVWNVGVLLPCYFCRLLPPPYPPFLQC